MGKDNTPRTNVLYTNISFTKIGDNNIASTKGTRIDDPRYGTKDNSKSGRCTTCFLKMGQCLGHHARYNLTHTIAKDICGNLIIQWLKNICIDCSGFIPSNEKIKILKVKGFDGMELVQKMTSSASKRGNSKKFSVCKHCGAFQPIYSIETKNKDKSKPIRAILKLKAFTIEKKDKSIRRMYSDEIFRIFERVTLQQLKQLGLRELQHPTQYLSKKIVLPGNNAVPSSVNPKNFASLIRHPHAEIYNKMMESDKFMSSIEYSYEDLAAILEKVESDLPISDKAKKFLTEYIHLEFLYHSYTNAKSDPSGKVVSVGDSKGKGGILAGIGDKKGYMREKVIKYVYFQSGRFVIAGNAGIPMDMIMIPQSLAEKFQIKDIVTEENIEKLSILLKNKRDIIPGATAVWQKKNDQLRVSTMLPANFILSIGDIVSRDVQDGDLLIFSRPPVLTMSSISAFTVIVNPDPTVYVIMMNINLCVYFNCDFDGDEMYITAITTPQGKNDARNITDVEQFAISPQSGETWVGGIQDTIHGLGALTHHKDIKIPKHMALYLSSIDNDSDMFFDNTKMYNLTDTITDILQKTPVTYKGKTNIAKSELTDVVKFTKEELELSIEEGVYKYGVMDKNSIGQGKIDSLFTRIIRKFGNKQANNSLFLLQHLAIQYQSLEGSSFNLFDFVITDDQSEKISHRINMIMAKTEQHIHKVINNKIVTSENITVRESFEALIDKELVEMDNLYKGVLFQDKDEIFENDLLRMILFGSKGKFVNYVSMVISVGQMFINGERLDPDLDRATPYGSKFDLRIHRNGFIMNPYIRGMTPEETYLQGKESRNNLIKKFLATAESGAWNRYSATALIDVHTGAYRGVSDGVSMFQELYANDGIDPRYIVYAKMPFVNKSDKEMKSDYELDSDELKIFIEMRTLIRRRLEIDYNTNVNDIILDGSIIVPIDINVIIDSEIRVNKKNSDLKENVEDIEKFIKELPYIYTNKDYVGEIPDSHVKATKNIEMLIRFYLRTQILKQLTNNSINTILNTIYINIQKALICPGTNVGIIASYTYCELLTQLALNAFHKAVGQGKTRGGEERSAEIFNLKSIDKEKFANCKFKLIKPFDTNLPYCREVAASIVELYFRDIIENPMYIKTKPLTTIEETFTDENWLAKKRKLVFDLEEISNFAYRFEIRKELLQQYNISIEDIKNRLEKEFPSELIVTNGESNKHIYIYIWLSNETIDNNSSAEFEGITNVEYFNIIVTNFENIVIKGIKGIHAANVVKENNYSTDINTTQSYYIRTMGTNLNSLFNIINVDEYSITSSSIIDTFDMFGIDAARIKISKELIDVVEERNVLARHTELIADYMSYTGILISINGSAVRKRNGKNYAASALTRAPVKQLTNAAARNTMYSARGLAASTLLGTMHKSGSNTVSYILDIHKITSKNSIINDELNDIFKNIY